MSTAARQAARRSVPARAGGSRFVIVAALALSLVVPAITLGRPTPAAASDVFVGGTATISTGDGDPVNLRDAPSISGDVIDSYPEGTLVEILDGPAGDDDGSLWWRVSVDGIRGYMIDDYLIGEGGGSGGDTTAVASINLRAGPSTADRVLDVIPAGAGVAVLGDSDNGFYLVSYQGVEGWAFGSYLDGFGAAGAGETLVVESSLNLRTGPGTSYDVITVMPGGAVVTLHGIEQNGYLFVEYDNIDGWAFADYLVADDGDVAGADVVDTTTTLSDLNLRAGPSLDDAVLTVMPSGAALDIIGSPSGDFYPVRYRGREGWAAAQYLEGYGSGDEDGGMSAAESFVIVWPVAGGEWEITQGYNGPYSHYNSGGQYQYLYSFDIARTDGATAGQPVYSPIDGTIRWTEQASGGISINMGNGYAVALFHVTLDASLQWDQAISQGQLLGYVSGPGGDGFAEFSHVHFTIWATDDGGNWSRSAVPFTGAFAVAGLDFYDTGGSNQWAGTVFYP